MRYFLHKTYKISITILFIIIFDIVAIKAQFLNDEFCGNKEILNIDYRKKPWKANNQFLTDYLDKINYNDTCTYTKYRIPVKFWIYRNNDGSLGASEKKIKAFMDSLNYFYKINNTGFTYYIREITKINKTKKLNLGYYIEAPFQTIIHHTKGCVNIYITDYIRKSSNQKTYQIYILRNEPHNSCRVHQC